MGKREKEREKEKERQKDQKLQSPQTSSLGHQLQESPPTFFKSERAVSQGQQVPGD